MNSEQPQGLSVDERVFDGQAVLNAKHVLATDIARMTGGSYDNARLMLDSLLNAVVAKVGDAASTAYTTPTPNRHERRRQKRLVK